MNAYADLVANMATITGHHVPDVLICHPRTFMSLRIEVLSKTERDRINRAERLNYIERLYTCGRGPTPYPMTFEELEAIR